MDVRRWDVDHHELGHEPQEALVLRAADVDDVVGDDGDGEADADPAEAACEEEEREGEEGAGGHHPGPAQEVEGQVHRHQGELGAQPGGRRVEERWWTR